MGILHTWGDINARIQHTPYCMKDMHKLALDCVVAFRPLANGSHRGLSRQVTQMQNFSKLQHLLVCEASLERFEPGIPHDGGDGVLNKRDRMDDSWIP